MDCDLIVRVSKKIWDRYNEFWCERLILHNFELQPGFIQKLSFALIIYYEVISYVADAVKFSRQIWIPGSYKTMRICTKYKYEVQNKTYEMTATVTLTADVIASCTLQAHLLHRGII